MEEASVQVKIPVFEGPLDLLLHLINKHEIDVYDIPVALITSQYLAYLELMESLNIEVAGEFLVMAATLIQIKSRLLLPQVADQEPEEDPRLELTRPLLDYLRFKEAARRLDSRFLLERDVFARPQAQAESGPEERSLFNLGLFDLLDAFKEVLERLKDRQVLDLKISQESLNDRISQLLEVFRRREHLLFAELFQAGAGRHELVLTFLAVLELARMGFVYLYQESAFGPIRLEARREAFRLEESWTG